MFTNPFKRKLPDAIIIPRTMERRNKFLLSQSEIKLRKIPKLQRFVLEDTLYVSISSYNYAVESHFSFSFAVPMGFRTDLASIPFGLRLFFRPDGPWAVPSIIHDYLYIKDTQCSKWIADLVFFALMRSYRVNFFICCAFWLAVTFFGWLYYPVESKKNTKT